MIPSRPWVLGLGFAGAVFAAVHAYVFRVILGAVSDPDNIGEQLSFLASNQALFLVWIAAAIGMWAVLVSLLPAIWRALGRGWPATAAVAGMFAGAVINIVGDGAQLPTVFLAAQHAAADEPLRAGLEAAASEVSAMVAAMLGIGIAVLFLGLVTAAVVSALRRPPAGRWYGSLFVLFGLANVPVGPPLVAAVLNLLVFAAIVYLSSRALTLDVHP
jgi:hypothetical protein